MARERFSIGLLSRTAAAPPGAEFPPRNEKEGREFFTSGEIPPIAAAGNKGWLSPATVRAVIRPDIGAFALVSRRYRRELIIGQRPIGPAALSSFY